MITDLKPYPAMEDPGVEWLGELPKSWDVLRSKRLFTPRKELAKPNDVQLSATQAYGVIPQEEYERRVGRKVTRITQHLDKRRHVEVNDFVISMRSFQGGLERAWSEGCIRSSYIVLCPVGDIDVAFYQYLFKSPRYIGALQSTANFIRDGQDLNFENFCGVDLPSPPLSEQAAIARYLDHVDRRVRRLVQTKRKLIALLTEQKQAIIHRAVTRGLDPDVPLKDSGVEWLGEVPDHWEVVPLKRIGKFSSGAGFPISAQGSSGREILFAKVSDMNRPGNEREILSSANTISRQTAMELKALIFPPTTIVFPKVGGALLTNKRRSLARESCIDNNLMGCIVTGAETDFAFQLLNWLDLGKLAKPGPVPAISEREVREIRVPLPPASEQAGIAEYIDEAASGVEAAITQANNEIQLLTEYRTRLVADVVTGKLDVREAAAALPEVDPLDTNDEPDDIEADDESDLEADLEEDDE